MKQTNGKFFLDSDVLLYLTDDTSSKKIAATALDAGCSILYSEDMQNGLVIDNRLTIVNPFL